MALNPTNLNHLHEVPRDREKESQQKKALGAICKEHRMSCGVSSGDFYKLYGVKQTTLSEFERGNSGNILFLFRYADLECSNNEKQSFIQKIVNLLMNGVMLDVDYTIPETIMTPDKVAELIQQEVDRQIKEKFRKVTDSEG